MSTEIQRGRPLALSTTTAIPDEDVPAEAVIIAEGLPQLSATMQRHVDRALASDRKGGEALWEKACAVADARVDAARYGEWTPFLVATGLHEREARRLIAIAERGRTQASFREAVISGWLPKSVAALAAHAEGAFLSWLLAQPVALTRREIEEQMRTPVSASDAPEPTPVPVAPALEQPPVQAAEEQVAARLALPAGWAWRNDLPGIHPRPLYQARRFDGIIARAAHDRGEAAENARSSERRKPPPTDPATWAVWVDRAAALPGGDLDADPLTGAMTLRVRGAPVTTGDWEQITAAIAAQEARLGIAHAAPPAPAEPHPDVQALIDRATAVGCTLTWRPDGSYSMREPDGTEAEHRYDLSVLARVRHFETTTTTTPPPNVAPEPAAQAILVEGDALVALIQDEEGDPVVTVSATGLHPLVAELIAQVAEALRRLCRGEAHMVDTVLLDDLSRRLGGVSTPARGTLEEVLELVAADAEHLTMRGVSVVRRRYQRADNPTLDQLSTELLSAEMGLGHGTPPDAADVARWQDTLDAYADELDDEIYERLAHRIGEQRTRAVQGET